MSRSRQAHKPNIVVVGPLGSTGGMASAMRSQVNGDLKTEFQLIPFDNSKRTCHKRSIWQGLASQIGILSELVRILGRYRPDIIHIHTCSPPTFYRSALDVLVARLYRGQVILHIHGGRFAECLQGASTFGRWLIKRVLKTVDQVVVLSGTWKRILTQFDDTIDPAVIPNGVKLPGRSRQWRQTARVRIVSVADLRKTKGVDDLILACNKLPQRIRQNCELVIIGPDRNQRITELQQRVRHLGLEEQVTFLGEVSAARVHKELRTATVFALPSYYEGLPIAMLEAMAHGLPCVVTDVGAVPEVITNGVEGLLVAPGDVAQLSRSLKKVIDDFELRKRLGSAARRKVRSNFSVACTTEALQQLYKDMVYPSNGAR